VTATVQFAISEGITAMTLVFWQPSPSGGATTAFNRQMYSTEDGTQSNRPLIRTNRGVTIYPTDDARVELANPNTNYVNSYLGITYDSDPTIIKNYMLFDISGWTGT